MYPSLTRGPKSIQRLEVLLRDDPDPSEEIAAIWAERIGYQAKAKDILTYAKLCRVRKPHSPPPVSSTHPLWQGSRVLMLRLQQAAIDIFDHAPASFATPFLGSTHADLPPTHAIHFSRAGFPPDVSCSREPWDHRPNYCYGFC